MNRNVFRAAFAAIAIAPLIALGSGIAAASPPTLVPGAGVNSGVKIDTGGNPLWFCSVTVTSGVTTKPGVGFGGQTVTAATNDVVAAPFCLGLDLPPVGGAGAVIAK